MISALDLANKIGPAAVAVGPASFTFFVMTVLEHAALKICQDSVHDGELFLTLLVRHLDDYFLVQLATRKLAQPVLCCVFGVDVLQVAKVLDEQRCRFMAQGQQFRVDLHVIASFLHLLHSDADYPAMPLT
jgi:hypothetical protein